MAPAVCRRLLTAEVRARYQAILCETFCGQSASWIGCPASASDYFPCLCHSSTLHIQFRLSITLITGGRDNSVGIAPELWARRSGDRIPVGGEIFRTRQDRSWSTPSLLYNGNRIFPGGKAARAWRWPPIPSRAEVKERIELYLYSTSGPSWPVIGWTVPLTTLTTWTSRRSLITVNTKRCSFGYQRALDWQILLQSILYSRE